VKTSSIHVNAWFGEHDKLTMTRLLLREQFGIEVDAERDRLAFVAIRHDSRCSPSFPTRSGRHIAAFADQLTHKPAYVMTGAEGRGFAEFVQRLLAARDGDASSRAPRRTGRSPALLAARMTPVNDATRGVHSIAHGTSRRHRWWSVRNGDACVLRRQQHAVTLWAREAEWSSRSTATTQPGVPEGNGAAGLHTGHAGHVRRGTQRRLHTAGNRRHSTCAG